MGEAHQDLVDKYNSFLLQTNELGRADLVERITTSVDDYHHLRAEQPELASGCIRVNIPLQLLRATDMWQQLRNDPLRNLRALEHAVNNIVEDERPGAASKTQVKVSLTGAVGALPHSPRQLTSQALRQLVAVEGVATKVSTIKPKVVKSTHYNPTTQTLTDHKYVDETDPYLGLYEIDSSGREQQRVINVTKATYPTQDQDGNPLETEFGPSQFKDYQTITLQEMPEKAPMGQLPRSVELILDHDLVDQIKPGDRVMVVGVYRALPGKATQGQQTSSGVFRTVVLVNSVQTLERDVNQLQIALEDINNIRAIAKRPDILNVLARSICPSIHGHDIIKKALALQLLSGIEKNLDNGTHLRGDINILMVGDPSTAKSQLLRAAMNIARLAVSTTGKGSSGVGLTAAVTSDPDTRERRLEAGAMVLADRGLVCVDEFDKMGENDRVAIHEAMEQQTVTIAKAGIHASLNARCSVLAAANPVYGQYDRRRRVQENIGLPDSLLSRFDLLFVVLDQMDPETDRRIASHVIRGHCYTGNQHTESLYGTHIDDDEEEEETAAFLGTNTSGQSVWQPNRHDRDNHDDDDDPHAHDVLQHDFLRKFLYYAKEHRVIPQLTDSSRDFIANRYAEMRARQDDRTLPITARSLETIIRLSTAHAKARLSPTVDAEPDCAVAMDILSFALYHEEHRGTREAPPPNKKRRVSFEEEDTDKDQSSKENVLPAVQEVWERLEDAGGVLSMDEFKDAEQAAVHELATQGRVQVADGLVYVI